MQDMHLLIAVGAYNERVNGLIKDGYQTSFVHESDGLHFTKLVHRNGNRVTVRFSEKDGYLSQSTNGKTVFCHKVY